MEERELRIGNIYRHYNGNKYLVLGTIEDPDTNGDLVIYKDVGRRHPRVWVRPLEKFMKPVLDGIHSKTQQYYRFELDTKIEVNPDKKLVKEIRKQLKQNNGYCPCSLIKDDSTKCMCEEFRNMEIGECHCGLYRKIPVNE